MAGNDGDLWIGTLADGVFHYRGGQLDESARRLAGSAGPLARNRGRSQPMPERRSES